MGTNLTNHFRDLNVESNFDDFYNYTTAGLWTTVAASSGTVAADDTQTSGKVSDILVTTAATAHDYAGIKTTKQNFLFDLRPMQLYGQFTWGANAASTAQSAGVMLGFGSTATTMSMTTGAPTLTGTAAVLYRSESGTVWKCSSLAHGGTQTDSTSNVSAVDGTYKLEIGVSVWDSANVLVNYFVNDIQLTDANNIPIQHKVAIASADKMNGFGLFQALTTSVQTGNIGYFGYAQRRI